jgi:DNA-binding LacI/PurR family transcriptional regulator
MTNIRTKPITIEDVARAAGVANSTASVALNGKYGVSEKTRRIVMEAAENLGFQPNPHAQRLVSGHNNVVGMFCPGPEIGAALEKNLLVQRLLDEQGLEVPLYSSGVLGGDRVRAQIVSLERLCRQRPRVIVCSTLNLCDDALEVLQRYQAGGGILVCYDVQINLDCDQVIFDRMHNNYLTASHLLELGHREIGLYLVERDNPSLRAAHPRLEGFQRALGEYGIETQPQWVFHGWWSEEDGARLAEQFMALEQRPTAMSIVNEAVASAFMNELARRGVSVPRDLSIASHDNMPVGRYASVPLTTASQPIESTAHHVVEMVSTRLSGEYSGVARRVVVCGELIQRESTAPFTA